MKVLVVEDEKKIASFIRKGLEAQGFVVEVATTATKGCCSLPRDLTTR